MARGGRERAAGGAHRRCGFAGPAAGALHSPDRKGFPGMLNSVTTRLTRPLSIRCALRVLARVSTHVLVIAPSTRGAFAFAQALCRVRSCIVTRGPLTAAVAWPGEDCLKSAAEISQAFIGQPAL